MLGKLLFLSSLVAVGLALASPLPARTAITIDDPPPIPVQKRDCIDSDPVIGQVSCTKNRACVIAPGECYFWVEGNPESDNPDEDECGCST